MLCRIIRVGRNVMKDSHSAGSDLRFGHVTTFVSSDVSKQACSADIQTRR